MYTNLNNTSKLPTAGEKPGYVDVTVTSQDYEFSLGETKVLYLDEDENRKILQRCVHNPWWRTELFRELYNASARKEGKSPPSVCKSS